MDDLSQDEVEQLSQVMGDNASPPEASQGASPEQVAESREEPSPPPQVPKGDFEAPADSSIARAQFMQLEELAEASDLPPGEMHRMHDIKVNVEVVLGRTKLRLNDILQLHAGGVVELNKLAGEPVDIMANNRLIARAEVVVVEDNFGIKILEIVGTQSRLADAPK